MQDIRYCQCTPDCDVPYGICHCNECGEKTKLAPQTAKMFGWVAGEPLKYIHGHQHRKPIKHVVEDRGYETPCWIWQGCTRSDGYGVVQRDGHLQRAHRYYYEKHVGPISRSLTLDHLCRNHICVNPAHLEPVTIGENVRRGVRARPAKTHCKRGHEFTPENTRIGKSGSRFCRECERERSSRRYRSRRSGIDD